MKDIYKNMNSQDILRNLGISVDIQLDSSETYDYEIAGFDNDYDPKLLDFTNSIVFDTPILNDLTNDDPTIENIKLCEFDNRINDVNYIYSGLTVSFNYDEFTNHFNILDSEGNIIHDYENFILNNDLFTYTGITNEIHYFVICEYSDTPVPTSSPTPEPTNTETPTPTETSTPLPSATSTETPLPTLSSTPNPTGTSTPIPTLEPTPNPTVEPTPNPTSTEIPTPIPTSTQAPTPTPNPTSTNQPTPNPTSTIPPTLTPNPTSTNQPTPNPTSTIPPTLTPNPTSTNQPTPEPTSTNQPTSTVEPTPTSTDVPQPTPTPTVGPTGTPVPNPTPTPTVNLQDISLVLRINNDGGVDPWLSGSSTYNDVQNHLCTYGGTNTNGTTRQTTGDPNSPQTGDIFYAGGFPIDPAQNVLYKYNNGTSVSDWRWIEIDSSGYITVSGFTCSTPTPTATVEPTSTPEPTPTSTPVPNPTATVEPTPNPTSTPNSTPQPTPTATVNLWVPTPDAWFDASDTSSYTLSGSNLTSVTDKAGNFNMSVDGTPTRVSNGLNNKNVWDFDGSESLISTNSGPYTSSGNHWAIGVFQFHTTDSTKDSFWSADGNRTYALSSSNSSSVWYGEIDYDGSNSIVSGKARNVFTQRINQSQWAIVAVIANKTDNEFYGRLNGNIRTHVDVYNNSMGDTCTDLRMMRNRSGVKLDGRMAEYFHFASYVGGDTNNYSEVWKAEGYLAHKWGLTSLLPSNHPYKNTQPTV